MSFFRPHLYMHIITNHLGATSDVNGKLWDLPELMLYGGGHTADKAVVFGANTAALLSKPLEKRINFVMTHDKNKVPPGFYHLESLDELCNHEEVHILGGTQVFKYFLPMTKQLNVLSIRGSNYDPGSILALPVISAKPGKWEEEKNSTLFFARGSTKSANVFRRTYINKKPLDLLFFGSKY